MLHRPFPSDPAQGPYHSDKEVTPMLQPLDDVEIMRDTVRDNGTMSYTLPDGHPITADIGDDELSAGSIITWCENVREIALARDQAKQEEQVEAKEERVPTRDSRVAPSPIEYAEAQIKAMEILYDRVSIELKAGMDAVDQLSLDLVEAEKMGRQWQDILDSLTETDAELQLRKKRASE